MSKNVICASIAKFPPILERCTTVIIQIILFNFGRLLECCPLGRQIIQYGRLGLYFRDVGWFRSVGARMPLDRFGEPLPWITYPCIDFLKTRLTLDMDVFEWGSGNSTLWWSKQTASVTSCEHDQKWYDLMKPLLPANVEYVYASLENSTYSNFAKNQSKRFDIIMIDGQNRVECAQQSLQSLKEEGVIVWDNTDLKKYQEGCDFLLNKGFKQLDFYGLGPLNFYSWCTTVFYREQNCLGI